MTLIWVIFAIAYVAPAAILFFMFCMLLKGQNWKDVYDEGQGWVSGLRKPMRYMPLWLIALLAIVLPVLNVVVLYLMFSYTGHNKQ